MQGVEFFIFHNFMSYLPIFPPSLSYSIWKVFVPFSFWKLSSDLTTSGVSFRYYLSFIFMISVVKEVFGMEDEMLQVKDEQTQLF